MRTPGSVELGTLDLASLDSVRSFADSWLSAHPDGLDILINNAGVMAVPRSTTVDGFEQLLPDSTRCRWPRTPGTRRPTSRWTDLPLASRPSHRCTAAQRLLARECSRSRPRWARCLSSTPRRFLAFVGGSYVGPDGFGEQRGHPKIVTPTKAARNVADARRLWQISEKLTGVSYLYRPA